MGHIKKFHDFFSAASSEMNEENDDKDLLRDLERVGMKEQTYTREMFQDAMNNVNFYEFFDAYPEQNFDFELGADTGDSTEVNAKFAGAIIGEWDETPLWNAIRSEVANINIDDYDEDDDEDRYEVGDLERAFDSFNWSVNASINTQEIYSEVDIDMDGQETTNGVYSVNAEVDLSGVDLSDYVNQDEIITDILDNL
jgi:hypothetical protein